MYENHYPNNFETPNRESQSSYTHQTSAVGTGNTYYYEESRAAAAAPEKHKIGAGRKIILGICCGLLFGIFAGLGFTAVTAATGALDVGQSNEAEVIDQIQDTAGQIQEKAEQQENIVQVTQGWDSGSAVVAGNVVTDVTEVVKVAMPSIVSVNNRYVETYSFWGQQYSNEGDSAGSGIIVGQNDTELLLVTNYHVVEAAEELTVQFVDGNQAQAQLKGSDADKDLAVIAVQLTDIDSDTRDAIAIASMGDSTQLTLGEPVVAIGNALGYGQSVTTGVVSALNRAIDLNVTQQGYGQQDTEVNTFIQTNAAINPGNSGGALLNIKGEVIGITSNKIGGAAIEGMGYAIPISDVRPIIEELMSKETRLRVSEEKKGYLGITGIDVVAEYARNYGAPQGVYVSSVVEGSGAAQAGLIRGDIITALNGEEITSMEELQNELSYYAAGETVELTIMQGSPIGYQAKSVMVTLGTSSSING